VLLPTNTSAISTGIQRKTIGAAAYAFPCSTWSRARHGNNGPPALRRDNAKEIMGVDHAGLVPGLVDKLKQANKLFFWLVKMLHLHIRAGVPFVLENPRLSLLWKAPRLQSILKHCVLAKVDFCMYGTPWRKPTTLAVFNLPGVVQHLHVCHSRGICQRTGKRHIILEGKDEHGCFWTKRATPYPLQFARTLADSIAEEIKHQRASRFNV
jgi:hypothetical protein